MRLAIGVCWCLLFAGCGGGDREIHPGLDFPAAWLPEGIDKRPYEILEQSQAKQDLIRKQSDFRRWCEERGFDVDEEAINSLEFVGGHWAVSPKPAATPTAAQFDDVISFAGQQWTLVGPAERNVTMFRVMSMQAMWYTAGDNNVRLIDEKWDKLRSERPTAYERIMQVQVRRNGRWISHGPMFRWEPKGGRDEMHYHDNELHGTQRAWHDNGQLRIEREWLHGKQHGLDRGWYEDGQQWYESQYALGEKVSSSGWNMDGTPYQGED